MTMWTTLGNALQPLLGMLDRHVPSAPKQPVILPRRVTPHSATPSERVNEIVERLDLHKTKWTRTSCQERAKLLRRCMDSLLAVEEDLARALATHKGSYGIGIGEERTALLPIMFGLAEYCETLRAGAAPKPLSIRERKDGQLVATVLPTGPVGLLLPNFRGEVWIEPSRPASQGAVYRRKAAGEGMQDGSGGVALVLGEVARGPLALGPGGR
ncbi:hypothetical protein Vretimale_3937 [Volvox reticuliferus]|uniref:Aldehyde dehydrogenase domain-containing protein n=1 Tax=Volvox reticuliferus TaxID=1737510 RepID=A0A8J4D9V8_9CHLO|nr:hypothetical protein Vretimale_3937 [Volvox reticuliferus]